MSMAMILPPPVNNSSKDNSRCRVDQVSDAKINPAFKPTSSRCITTIASPHSMTTTLSTAIVTRTCPMTHQLNQYSKWLTLRRATSRVLKTRITPEHLFRLALLKPCTNCKNRSSSRPRLSFHPVMVIVQIMAGAAATTMVDLTDWLSLTIMMTCPTLEPTAIEARILLAGKYIYAV